MVAARTAALFWRGVVRDRAGAVGLGEVDPGILSLRQWESAQGVHRRQTVPGVASGDLGLGDAQPVLQLVGKRLPESLVERGRFVPLLLRLRESSLDRQPLLARQAGGQVEGSLRLLDGPLVVAELAPGLSQRGVGERR